jgi:hypothetical protein
VEQLKGASLRYALALLANIRLGWKGITGTSTLAYFEHSLIMALKSFITLGTV